MRVMGSRRAENPTVEVVARSNACGDDIKG